MYVVWVCGPYSWRSELCYLYKRARSSSRAHLHSLLWRRPRDKEQTSAHRSLQTVRQRIVFATLNKPLLNHLEADRLDEGGTPKRRDFDAVATCFVLDVLTDIRSSLRALYAMLAPTRGLWANLGPLAYPEPGELVAHLDDGKNRKTFRAAIPGLERPEQEPGL